MSLLARRIDLEEGVKDHADVLVCFVELTLKCMLLLKLLQTFDHHTIDDYLVVFLAFELLDLSNVAVMDLRDVSVQLLLCLLEVIFVLEEVLLVGLIMFDKHLRDLVFECVELLFDSLVDFVLKLGLKVD